MALLLAIDPSKAERLIQSFGIGDGGFSGFLLENTQPNTIRLAMICGQPLTKLRGCSKAENFIHTEFIMHLTSELVL